MLTVPLALRHGAVTRPLNFEVPLIVTRPDESTPNVTLLSDVVAAERFTAPELELEQLRLPAVTTVNECGRPPADETVRPFTDENPLAMMVTSPAIFTSILWRVTELQPLRASMIVLPDTCATAPFTLLPHGAIVQPGFDVSAADQLGAAFARAVSFIHWAPLRVAEFGQSAGSACVEATGGCTTAGSVAPSTICPTMRPFELRSADVVPSTDTKEPAVTTDPPTLAVD